MDRESAVASPAASVAAEQAIFTSIRSPLGTGYRLVAASPGLSNEDRRAIVQVAPSHGNLACEAADATGFVTLPLPSGRRAVLLACHAGPEHTNRGGLRVHTQAVAIDPGDFARAFRGDALRLAAAARALLTPETLRSPPISLGRTELRPGDESPGAADPPPEAEHERLAVVLAAALVARSLVVLGHPRPEQALRWTLAALPLGGRVRLSTAFGLKLASSRMFDVTWADAAPAELERWLSDRPCAVLDWATGLFAPAGAETAVTGGPEFEPADAAALAGDCRGWIGFARRCWRAGDTATLHTVADGLADAPTPARLALAVLNVAPPAGG